MVHFGYNCGPVKVGGGDNVAFVLFLVVGSSVVLRLSRLLFAPALFSFFLSFDMGHFLQ